MDPIIQTFLNAGGELVAGDLLYKRQVVGMCRHGQVILTPEGEDALRQLRTKAEVQDVEIKVFTPAQEAPAPAAEAPAPAAEAPAPAAEAPAPAAEAPAPAAEAPAPAAEAPAAPQTPMKLKKAPKAVGLKTPEPARIAPSAPATSLLGSGGADLDTLLGQP